MGAGAREGARRLHWRLRDSGARGHRGLLAYPIFFVAGELAGRRRFDGSGPDAEHGADDARRGSRARGTATAGHPEHAGVRGAASSTDDRSGRDERSGPDERSGSTTAPAQTTAPAPTQLPMPSGPPVVVPSQATAQNPVTALPPYSPEDKPSFDHLGSTYIPMDSWVYPEMTRLYSMGYLDTMFLGMRPWTRRSALHMLQESQNRYLSRTTNPEASGS